jgi:hypothetical protein
MNAPKHPHGHCFTYDDLHVMGMNVHSGLPKEVKTLCKLLFIKI